MKILSATQTVTTDGVTVEGEDVSPEQVRADLPELVRRHKRAVKSDPMWGFFGGTIEIDNRTYQVAP